MVRIVAKLNLKKDCKEEFIKGTKDLILGSRSEEGCLDYDLYQSQSDENTVTFIEGYKDMKAIEAHNKSSHFTKILPLFKQYIESQEITVYDSIK